MNLASLVQHIASEATPDQLIKDVSKLLPQDPLNSLVDDLVSMYTTELKPSVEKAAWHSKVEEVFNAHLDAMDTTERNKAITTCKNDWTQRHFASKVVPRLRGRFNKIERPMFSEKARENTAIPTLTATQWLSQLANGTDLITWGFDGTPKSQTGREFGLEFVGPESKLLGVPLEVRSLPSAPWIE